MADDEGQMDQVRCVGWEAGIVVSGCRCWIGESLALMTKCG